ncbi:hypothetical protein Q7P36_002050 [Cladosporium allicinum]
MDATPSTPPPPRDDNSKEAINDPLALPSPEVLAEIARKQEARAAEIQAARLARRRSKKGESASLTEAQNRSDAAVLIQKNYRGHRTRRAMEGRSLDPSVRWIEALKDAKYNNVTAPRPRATSSLTPTSPVRERWKRAVAIAHRAGSDDFSESEIEGDTEEERAASREAKAKEKRRREKYAKTMGLDYFLEMVDNKHRYGSNLRRYHKEWKQSQTHENFFYWLDHGEGKDLDLPDRPRTRLDTELVRYLSREERQKYLVHIDDMGRFVFSKNGIPVTTAPEFKDSINGIVRHDDPTPTWREVTTGVKEQPAPPGDSDSDAASLSSMSSIGTGKQEDNTKYTNNELHDARGLAKLNHINANSVMNHLLRKTTKKNTWIFVADTNMRLYVGIKQSGAFQHSSFLHGARVAAAGLIKIKRGQLRKLSPLSGHYAPPVRNFREFVRCLKETGADMSRCSISRSYAVILGLEGYIRTKDQAKKAERGVRELVNPEEKRRREKVEFDASASAAREREVLRQERERRKSEGGLGARFRRSLGLGSSSSTPVVQEKREGG